MNMISSIKNLQTHMYHILEKNTKFSTNLNLPNNVKYILQQPSEKKRNSKIKESFSIDFDKFIMIIINITKD